MLIKQNIEFELRWPGSPLVVHTGVAKIFDWGGNHKSHAMTSSETSKEEFFVGGKDIVE